VGCPPFSVQCNGGCVRYWCTWGVGRTGFISTKATRSLMNKLGLSSVCLPLKYWTNNPFAVAVGVTRCRCGSNLVQTAQLLQPLSAFLTPAPRPRTTHPPPHSPRPPRCQPSAFSACCSRTRKRYHLQASHQHLTQPALNANASHNNYNALLKTQRKTPGKFQERGGLHHLLRHLNHHPQLSPEGPCSPQSPNASHRLLRP
jgi:hypothetical protein